MAPTLKSTDAEGSESDQRHQTRIEMNHSRINEGVPRHNADTAPANSQIQRVDGSSSLATTHQTNDTVRTELATATAEQHENQATLTKWLSPLVSPLSRLVGGITQPRQIPDDQLQHDIIVNLMNQIREQGEASKVREAELNAKLVELTKILEEYQQASKERDAEVTAILTELTKKLDEYHKDKKREHKRNKVKKEKPAGMPKRVRTANNFFLSDKKKSLLESGHGKNWIKIGQQLWMLASVEERSRYRAMSVQDRGRYEQEKKAFDEKKAFESSRSPTEDRKPAAKPTPEEIAATAAADHPQDPYQSPHEEPVAAAVAVEGSGGSGGGGHQGLTYVGLFGDNQETLTSLFPSARSTTVVEAQESVVEFSGGYQPSEYEQQRERNIARNEERLRSLGLQSESTSAVKARKSSKKRGKKRENAFETPSRRSPRKPRHSSGAAASQCPVGHEFTLLIHWDHDEYACAAEVVGVEGEWRHCKYDHPNGEEKYIKLDLATIQEA